MQTNSDHGKTVTVLRESNECFRLIFDQAAVGFTYIGLDGCFLRVNQKFCDIVGYSREELLRRTCADISYPGDSQFDFPAIHRLLTDNGNSYAMEKRYLRRDGAGVWCEVSYSLALDEAGEPLWFVALVQDIGQRKRAEERLCKSDDKYRTLLENLPQKIFLKDVTGKKKAESKLQDYQRKLRALASELTLTEERERRHIAEDLHDNVGQSLSFMRIQLAVARKECSGHKAAVLLDEVSTSLRSAIQDTRNIISDLSSPVINELGLSAAVAQWLDERIGEYHGLETIFFDDGQAKPLGGDTETILFRSVRELLNNVVKHADASRVSVSFRRIGNCAQLVVEDDGLGLAAHVHPDRDGNGAGFGLFSIRERMADLDGSLTLESHPGPGLKAILIAPLEVEA